MGPMLLDIKPDDNDIIEIIFSAMIGKKAQEATYIRNKI
jgi:hypothetical protein